LKVVIPSNPADAYGLMLSAINDPDPVIFIETLPALFTPGPAPERHKMIPIGKANVVRRGNDLTVIAYGRIVQGIATLAEKLAGEVDIELIDLRSVSPLDLDTILASVAKTGAAVVVHEAVKAFGPGGEISSVIHERLFDTLRGPVIRIGAKYAPVPFSKPLETASLPSLAEVEAAVRSFARSGRNVAALAAGASD
jgi:pyruvate dehydrogenase E1 component beta subunit